MHVCSHAHSVCVCVCANVCLRANLDVCDIVLCCLAERDCDLLALHQAEHIGQDGGVHRQARRVRRVSHLCKE